ncbi:hypothetical protein GCM10007876_21270 [Litoribrevibacter albus]|uniref:Uncharacterized protein n=2 Tax=Litoribrevibacter albus TaxID=1473156 RepID=A0AA37W7Q2_9GAMM|nr:hypothetical protein GCM10007876_21270 [Litoribrevibacter albus]
MEFTWQLVLSLVVTAFFLGRLIEGWFARKELAKLEMEVDVISAMSAKLNAEVLELREVVK